MALPFVSTGPTFESHHGHCLVTFESGGDAIQLLLTRWALGALFRGSKRAIEAAFAGECEQSVIVPFVNR